MNAQTRRLLVDGPVGALEVAIDEPPNAQGLAPVLHPLPTHGGTMDNKVVQTLARACVPLGYRTVRFNFRGVGQSEGGFDNGPGEIDDAEAVLTEANDSEYGLAASLWTNNLKVGLDLAHRLEAGLVQINQNLVVQANLSYGGVKSSGLGKEASLEAMLEHFTHKKTIMVNIA